jgi:uncharacterized protein (DUF302 family)
MLAPAPDTRKPLGGKGMTRVTFLAVLTSLWLAPWAHAQSVAEAVAKGSFDEIKQLLVVAIENQGLVVDHQSKVGEMLERTGKDLGATRKPYERAEVLEFCSANYSRQMMEADHRLLAFCPFAIGIYTLPGEPDTVHLVYRRMQAQGVGPAAAEALGKVDSVLAAILLEAK